MKHYQPKTNAGTSTKRLLIRWLSIGRAFLSSGGRFMTLLCARGLGLLRAMSLLCIKAMKKPSKGWCLAKATPSWIFCFPPSNLKRNRRLEMLERVRVFSVVSSLTRYSGHCLAFRPLSLSRLFLVKLPENNTKAFFKNLYATICRNSRMLKRSVKRFVSTNKKLSTSKAGRLSYGRI